MSSTPMKVGELAARTGLTVRTLHHYDELGLLSPSRRTAAGHRLYGVDEIARLQQIRSLQQLGFSLGEIGRMLDTVDFSPQRVVEMHLGRLREQIATQQQLYDRLERIAQRLNGAEVVSADEFIRTIEAMTMFEKYYTPEQMEYLEKRKHEVGEERMQAVAGEWQELYARARELVEQGADPASEEAQELVRKQQSLIEEFTGGDAGILASLTRLRKEEGTVREQYGPSPEVGEFLQKAAAGTPSS